MSKITVVAIAAIMLFSCEKQSDSALLKSTSINKGTMEIKGYLYKRADIMKLLNQGGIQMDGVRFYKEGYGVGTRKDAEGYYIDYVLAELKSVNKIGGYPCPDWCSK